ncbi:MAG: hypothetical protein BWK78_05100, partial [Thiotrichaceae bacterium IS1]
MKNDSANESHYRTEVYGTPEFEIMVNNITGLFRFVQNFCLVLEIRSNRFISFRECHFMHKSNLLSRVAQIATLSAVATLSFSVSAESPPLPIGGCPADTQTIARFDSPDVGNNWGYRYPEGDDFTNVVNLADANWTSEAPITQIVCKGVTYPVSPDGKSGTLPAPCSPPATYTKLQFCGSVTAIPQCNDWKFVADSFEDGTTGRNFRGVEKDGKTVWSYDHVAGKNVRNKTTWLPAPRYLGDPLVLPRDSINEAEIYGMAIKETMT